MNSKDPYQFVHLPAGDFAICCIMVTTFFKMNYPAKCCKSDK